MSCTFIKKDGSQCKRPPQNQKKTCWQHHPTTTQHDQHIVKATVECKKTKTPLVGFIHRILKTDESECIKTLKNIMMSGYLMANQKGHDKCFPGCDPGVYTSPLTKKSWDNLQDALLGEELKRPLVVLVFSKALMFAYKYFINTEWEFGLPNKKTSFHNAHESNPFVSNGLDEFFLNTYQPPDDGEGIQEEMVFTDDVSLQFLQEIWVSPNVMQRLLLDDGVPQVYKDILVDMDKITCKDYTKQCISGSSEPVSYDCEAEHARTEQQYKKDRNAYQTEKKTLLYKTKKKIFSYLKILFSNGTFLDVENKEFVDRDEVMQKMYMFIQLLDLTNTEKKFINRYLRVWGREFHSNAVKREETKLHHENGNKIT
jgi:hypothetical protein